MLREKAKQLLMTFPALLARVGIVDRKKGSDAFDLAVPMMITGGIRTLMRALDFFMVSVAAGGAAVAGLEFGFQYYFIGFGLALSVSSGTISVVSRFKGADEHRKANVALKQSLWLALIITVPLTAVTWFYADSMIGLLTDDGQVIRLGGEYLRIVMLSVVFRFWGMIASRALAGSGDTRTPMYVRLITIPTNIILNAVLIFGLGPFQPMGVTGAAIGTAVANTLAAVIFFGLLLTDRYHVRLPLGGTQFDFEIIAEIIRVGAPIAGTRLFRTFGRFPFLFLLSLLGTQVVAAYAISRRIMLLAMMPAWGYSTASSTLVGQSLGAGDSDEADEYGWQTLRLALCTQALIAGALVVSARPIVSLFGTEDPGLVVDFVRLFAVVAVGFGVSRTMRGGLRGAGDMRWPFYGTVLGTVVRLLVAAFSIPVGATVILFGFTLPAFNAGIAAIFAAILADAYIKAIVNTVRFKSGAWKRISSNVELGKQ